MNNNQLLSVIVPSYKTKIYLDSTLPHFISDELNGKIIVYLIDDGSPDDTPLYLKRYVEKFPKTFAYIHKDNGGHGSVINYAVHSLVKTKYFMVVDGDDFVNTDQLIILVNMLNDIDDDILVLDYCTILNKKKNLVKNYNYDEICSLDVYNLFFTLHSVVFKTSLWTKNNILLTEGVFYEDKQYCLYPKFYCKSATYIPLCVYNYNLGMDFQSVNPNNVIKRKNDLLCVLDDIITFTKNNSLSRDNEIINYALYTERSLYDYYYQCILYHQKGIWNTYKDLKKLYIKYKNSEFLIDTNKSYSFLYILLVKSSFFVKRLIKSSFSFLYSFKQ